MKTTALVKTVTALPLVAVLALAGCGGGGSSSGATPPMDQPVTSASLSLPSGHGLPGGSITVEAGMTAEHGNVAITCPAGGAACTVTVAADGTATYERTGGMPTVAVASASLSLPSGHGLPGGPITVKAGMTAEHGNVAITCPAGGAACTVTVAADGTATYERTGGMPTVAVASASLSLPSGHGLPGGPITVEAGMTAEHGNVAITCPAGGAACTVTVAADGTAAYERTGGMPTVAVASASLSLPSGHGLPGGPITVEAGMTAEHGNVAITCPAGGAACTVTVAADGTATYERTGGMPTVAVTSASLSLPSGHGLPGGPITVEAGMTAEHGNVAITCPAGGAACTVTVAADSTATYERTGGMPTVAAVTGVAASEHPPYFAASAGDTLASLLPNAANSFSTLSSSIRRDSSTETAAATDRFSVSSVASDGDGGFHVTYVLDGIETEVHFSKNDFGVDFPTNYTKIIDRRQYHLFSYTGRFDGVGYGETTEFEYLRAMGTSYPNGGRTQLIYGAQTPTTGMPMGTARYSGRMNGDAYDNTLESISTSVARSFVRGSVVLSADFTDGNVSGRIFRLQMRKPGSTDYADMSSTTRFEITNGEIADGQFMASLTGVDDNPSAPLDESVRGFEGNVLGGFYGPGAEEVGGVLNAARAEGDDDDWTLLGWFGGSRLFEYTDAEAFSSGVDRHDYSTANPRIESQADGNRVTGVEVAVAESGVNEYTIHYRADGLDRTIFLGAEELGANASFSSAYSKQDSGWSYLLFPNSAGRHYNLSQWFRTKFPNENYNNSEIEFAQALRLVHGSRTPQENMPTSGTATYAGSAVADVWIPSPGQGRASSRFSERYRGNLALSADFAGGGGGYLRSDRRC